MQRSIITLITIFLISPLSGYGQYSTINYQLEKNYFNEGQALPAERSLMFTGAVPAGIDIIEISIFPAKAKKDKDRLYLAFWKDFDQDDNTSYSLAVNYQLRASEQYDFRFDFYRKLTAPEQAELTERMINQTLVYLEANISRKGRKMELAKSHKRIVRELEDIIVNALADYRNQNGMTFEGLSETLGRKLEKLEDVSLTQMTEAEKDDKREMESLARGQIGEAGEVVITEIREIMSRPWSKLAISRYVDDYETESRKGSFSVSAGYGGVYLSGELDELNYGTAAYLGIAFPLSNSTIAPTFLRNSSVVMGAFLENFKDENGNTISGLIVDRPIYLGLDYKLFEFIRFNAGASFLEKREVISSGNDAGSVKANTLIRPFVGLSARIDITVGFGK